MLYFFFDLTGIQIPRHYRQAGPTILEFFNISGLVYEEPASVGMDILYHFEMYHAIMDLFCLENSCTGDVDLMGNALKNIENMSGQDIDLAINIYNIADRYEVDLFEDQKI